MYTTLQIIIKQALVSDTIKLKFNSIRIEEIMREQEWQGAIRQES